jgi:trk system potassium uptake protein TrkA
MKFIIVGLGNFGASLSIKLTRLGHEVIGVDNKMEKINMLKEQITHTICVDCTDPQAVTNLPLKETDIVIIGIGENEGASIMATAVMKQNKVKRIISRAVTPLQSTVLEAMGIQEIIHPEEEAADRLAKRLNIKGVLDSFELSGEFNIVEAKVPDHYAGKTLQEAGIVKNFNVVVLTTMKERESRNILGVTKNVTEVKGVANSNTVLQEDEIMVLFGKITDIKRLLKED